MRVFLLTILCAVALKAVVAESENEVKRGAFPFMAFLYYTDEKILDGVARFTRSAALIRNNWLISSGDVSVAFPQKTLLARLGAVNIDTNFTLNEDEEEQEREVSAHNFTGNLDHNEITLTYCSTRIKNSHLYDIILVLRPYNYSATEWWKTDISLLKTLLPFNMTSSVAPATLISNFDNKLQNCYILVFSRRNNATERSLLQINVELLPQAQEHCGNYYKKETMVCAESDKSNTLADSNFCKGNSGGPLLCDSEYVGLQTYINDCKQPHLYQFVPGWNKLITCAEKERYLTPACADVCVAITKDPSPSPTPDSPKVPDTIGDIIYGDKFFTQSILTEFVSTQFNTDATDSSTASKVEELATLNKLDTEVLSTKMKEEQKELITADTSISIEISSHDTTSTSTYSTYAEEDAMVDTTGERDRKNRIEAKQQLVRGEASLNIPSLFHYLITSVYVLAHT